MYCSYKTQFYNGNFNERPIVTMEVKINNSKKLNALDNEGRDNLIKALNDFKQRVGISIEELEKTKSV